jgi:hypothetical protein
MLMLLLLLLLLLSVVVQMSGSGGRLNPSNELKPLRRAVRTQSRSHCTLSPTNMYRAGRRREVALILESPPPGACLATPSSHRLTVCESMASTGSPAESNPSETGRDDEESFRL